MLRPLRVAFALAAGSALVALAARQHVGLSLRPPHRSIRPSAVLAGQLRAELDAESSSDRPRTTAELVHFALGETSARLRLDLQHRTDFTFFGTSDAGEERPANCEEYAQLFVAVFRHVARLRDIPGRATVVRSEARLFGRVLPWRAWRTHDWVRVEDGSGKVIHVDPTLDDAGLGWDVSGDLMDRERSGNASGSAGPRAGQARDR